MIYFLEDDNNIRNFVIYALNNTGLEAEGFDHPDAFWEAMKKKQPDLLLLDIMLPGEDGISILKKIRSNNATKTMPVIMLTDSDLLHVHEVLLLHYPIRQEVLLEGCHRRMYNGTCKACYLLMLCLQDRR